MNVDFLIMRADAIYKKAEQDAAKGISSAKSTYAGAAKEYRKIADLDPSRKQQFIAKAEECEAKAQQDVAKVTYVTPGSQSSKEPAKQVNANDMNQQQNQQQNQQAEKVVEAHPEPNEDELKEALNELNELIGLSEVKTQINDWVKQIQIFQIRKQRGLPIPPITYHMVFTGNPGTGKTTVARLIAKIYHSLGIIRENKLKEVGREDLVAAYVGQTAIKTKEVLNEALGGILFIDEAYTLKKEGNDFGQEAIDTLLKVMEDQRDEIAVIAAGYEEDMKKFINANAGLASRFKNFINFADYNGSDLNKIFLMNCKKKKYILTEEARTNVRNYLNELYKNRGSNFGNARDVRNLFENVVTRQAVRLSTKTDLTDEELCTIENEDLPFVTNENNEDNKPKSQDNEIVKLCIKLESVLKNKYGLDGDLYNMVENYIQGYAKDRNEYNVLHKLRMKRNNIVHAENNNVIFTDNDFDKCRIIITAMEEANVSNANTYSGNITINQQNVSAVADAQKESKPVAYKQNSKNNYANYFIPYKEMLKVSETHSEENPAWLEEKKQKINATLDSFGVDGEIISYTKGPTFTLYEIMLASGVNVKKVTQIKDNLAMCLAAKSLRIMAPIPGKATVGIEAPNDVRDSVAFGDIISDDFVNDGKPLNVAIGKYIDNSPVYQNIAEMPHALIAGATQSGKSVSINTIICSLILKNSPENLKLILVDPKRVEFTFYENIPHLACPIITDPELANRALKWLENEMERRYDILSENRTRNIADYNKKREEYKQLENLPYIVVIIDEFNDLIMQSGADVNDSIVRLAQKARACGIHVILATQRPTTNVISGTIKANIPCRISFRVAQTVDSMTILDEGGAEDLLGKGDMLFKNNSIATRAQGAYVSDKEIDSICDYLREKYQPDYMFNLEDI